MGPSATTGGAVRRSGVAYVVFAALRSPRVAAAALRYLATVGRFFFLSQHSAALGGGRRAAVRVDHPLDGLVPFRADKVDTYLGFIRVWISELGYARRRLGPGSTDAIVRFIDGLSACYIAAYGVYRRRLSTTTRPERAANVGFSLIYLVDPHLYCVPSLHVMIACYAFLAFPDLLGGLGLDEEASAARVEVYRWAVSITDSIVYVRQHSVNCIPAALYVMSRLRPEFGRERAAAFIADLFAGMGPAGASIRAYMGGLYSRFMDEGEDERGDYRRVLLRFLDGYPSSMPR